METRTSLTTDQVVCNRSDMCLRDEDGVIHYSVMVEKFHALTPRDPGILRQPPFLVFMCEMLVAYDHATGWFDLMYPMLRFDTTEEFTAYPTCVWCSGA